MARKVVQVDLDISAAVAKVQELAAQLDKLRTESNISIGAQGLPGNGLMGTFSSSSGPGINPATTGGVTMSGGSASVSVPGNVAAGPPSLGVFGSGFGTGQMNMVSGTVAGTPANGRVPSDSEYDFSVSSGSAPDQPGWADGEQFAYVRGHFRRHPRTGRAGGAGAPPPPSATVFTEASAPSDDDMGAPPMPVPPTGGAGGGAARRRRRARGNNNRDDDDFNFEDYIGFRTARELARGASDVANEYTRYTISGEPNPLALGQSAGLLGGGLFATGLIAGGMGLGPAGMIGAIAAPLIGAGVNAFQAPAIQRQNIAASFSVYGAASGQDPNGLASGAAQIASQQNSMFYAQGYAQNVATGNPVRDFIGGAWATADNYLRRWGMHVGTDQISAQDVAAIEQAVGSAASSVGETLTPEQLRSASQRYVSMGGPTGKPLSQASSAAVSRLGESGGNLFSLSLRVGADATKLAANMLGMPFDVEQGRKDAWDYQIGQSHIAGAEAIASGLGSEYERSAFSGKTTFARRPEFDRMQAALRADYDLTASEYNRMQSGPQRDSVEAKGLFARGQQDLLQIDRNQAQRSEGIVGDISAAGRANLAAANYQTSMANLFGGEADLRRAGASTFATLMDTANRLEATIGLPGQTAQQMYDQRALVSATRGQALQQRTQLVDAGQQRRFLSQDVNVSVFAADLTASEMFGTDSQLGATFAAAVGSQDFIANDAFTASQNQSASVEQKARDQVRSANARQQSLNLRARSLDVLLSRIGGRASIAESDASNVLLGAAYGDAGDVERAGAGFIGALGSERASLQDQLRQGGLTVEQDIRLRSRVSSIEGQQIRAQIDVRDTVLGRVETTANLANQAASNELNRSLRLGTGSDVRSASGGMLSSLGNEYSRLQEQIDRGGLTFDQRSRVQERQQSIGRSVFDIGQNAIDESIRRDDMSGFGLASIENSAARRIASLMPYGSGGRLSADVRTIRTNQQQLGVLQQREEQLRRSGNLSPERLSSIREQEANLGVEIASGIAGLTENVADYLPGLSAGRGANYSMYDSLQLAALRVNRTGSNIRSFGAINGAQAARQAHAWDQLSGGMISGGPHSLTQGINQGRGTGAMEILLTQIRDTLQRIGSGNTGSTQRIGESAGQAAGQISQRDVGYGYGGRKL